MNGKKLIKVSPKIDAPYLLRSSCRTPEHTNNESSYKSTNSNFTSKRSLIYVTREDDDEDDEIEFEENNNVYDIKQESEHRNYRDFLESGEEVYGRVDSCFRACPIHCITPVTSTPLGSSEELKSTSKSTDRLTSKSTNRSNSQTKSKSSVGKTVSRSTSNKSPEIKANSPSLVSNISDRLRSKCNCSKPSRINMYGANDTTAMKIEERSCSKIKESIKEQIYKRSAFRNLHEISTKEASCQPHRSILRSRRRYQYFYEPYLDRAYLRWWAIRDYIQYDLFSHQNVVKLVGYSMLMIIFFLLHLLIKNDILISAELKKSYKSAVWNCMNSVEQFVQYLALNIFGVTLLSFF